MRALVNGAQIAYDEAGSGEALVLIHAGIADRTMWDHQIRTFASGRRVIRLDLRGFGESEMLTAPFAHHDDVLALLDVLAVKRAAVAGISMGGEVALAFALAHPDRVDRLVLVSTLAGMDTPSDALRAIWLESDAVFKAGDIEGATAIEVGGWIAGAGRRADDLDPVYREHATRMIRQIWERAAREEAMGEEIEPGVPARERLGELHMPVLLIRGDRDLPDVKTSMDVLQAGIAAASLHVIPDTAHLPPLERPAEFNALLSEFLTGD